MSSQTGDLVSTLSITFSSSFHIPLLCSHLLVSSRFLLGGNKEMSCLLSLFLILSVLTSSLVSSSSCLLYFLVSYFPLSSTYFISSPFSALPLSSFPLSSSCILYFLVSYFVSSPLTFPCSALISFCPFISSFCLLSFPSLFPLMSPLLSPIWSHLLVSFPFFLSFPLIASFPSSALISLFTFFVSFFLLSHFLSYLLSFFPFVSLLLFLFIFFLFSTPLFVSYQPASTCVSTSRLLSCFLAPKAQRSVIVEHLQAQGSRHNTPNTLCWARGKESVN